MDEHFKKTQTNTLFLAASQTSYIMLSFDMENTVEMETVRNSDKEKRLQAYWERLQNKPCNDNCNMLQCKKENTCGISASDL